MLILELFFRAHQAGLVLREDDLSSHGARIDLEHWSDYRQMLIALNLIRSVDKGGLVLSRDLREVSLWDLHQSSGWPMPATIKGSSPWERALAENLQTINQHNKALLKGDLESLFRLEDKE
jgi:DNA-binding IscR family transcriptional regulator